MTDRAELAPLVDAPERPSCEAPARDGLGLLGLMLHRYKRVFLPGVVLTVVLLVVVTAVVRHEEAPVGISVTAQVRNLAAREHVDLMPGLRDVVQRTRAALDLPHTTVKVELNADGAIPEIGVGGYTDPRTGAVTISVAEGSPVGPRLQLTSWLQLTVAHELNHSARVLAGPGYGTRLLDIMVTEGMADEFAAAQVPTVKAPWADALDSRQRAQLWDHAEPLLMKSNFATNRQWLFGGGDVPRWTAYTLGSGLVRAYRVAHPKTSWSVLARMHSDEVLKASGYEG